MKTQGNKTSEKDRGTDPDTCGGREGMKMISSDKSPLNWLSLKTPVAFGKETKNIFQFHAF